MSETTSTPSHPPEFTPELSPAITGESATVVSGDETTAVLGVEGPADITLSGTGERNGTTPPRPPPVTTALEAVRAIEGTLRRLRAEHAGASGRAQKARLLGEIGELEERAGDEPAAARDYLAAFNTDPSFREPLEGLIRLLERRRSLKNIARVVDALVRAADTGDERARALLMRAAFLEDATGDTEGARIAARDAAEAGAPPAETATAWLTLELIAARLGDARGREEALEERAKLAADSTWRGLLIIDVARLAAASGDVDRALSLLDEARALGAGATYLAAVESERIAVKASDAARGTPEAQERARVGAAALETQATLIRTALAGDGASDERGVPRWARTPAHAADAWLRAAELYRVAGDVVQAADVLDRALASAAEAPANVRVGLEPLLFDARLRVAEEAGDASLAGALTERLLAEEKDGGARAALALRLAEQAIATEEREKALDYVAEALASDPASLPARSLELDLLATSDAGMFAAKLEALAEHLTTEDARGQTYLVASYVWGVLAGDSAGARAALSQAALCGVDQATVARLARTMASLRQDTLWYEEATRRLLASGPGESEAASLWVELARSRLGRGDDEAARKALAELGATPRGAWLGRAIEAFLVEPGEVGERQRAALDELAANEADPALARSLTVVAAARAFTAGVEEGARARLRELAAGDPADALVAVYLGELERAAGAPMGASRAAAACAAATADAELAAALQLEAGLERWRNGDRRGAMDAFVAASDGAPQAAHIVLAWASRGVDVDVVEGRRRAIDRGMGIGGGGPGLALERFATELSAGSGEEAMRALAMAEADGAGDVAIAAALGRVVAPSWATKEDALRSALARIGAAGADATTVAAAELLRIARSSGDADATISAARAWFDAGGGLAPALEWLALTSQGTETGPEYDARHATAVLFEGEAREALIAGAEMLRVAGEALTARAADAPSSASAPRAIVEGRSPAARLASLELAKPGSDPRRRAATLTRLEAVDFGGDAGDTAPYVDATSLAGWSYLAAGDPVRALACFETAATSQPDDLGAWEGLRTAAEAIGDQAKHAGAASELGARCADDARGAAYWEEAAHLLVAMADEALAEVAFEASFARDGRRAVAFDKLFRRVREKKEGERLLALIKRRLELTDDPPEIAKLFWEQARVMREKGDADAALKALENVTMLEPDHVGALALSGEIFIRKGRFAEAADHLARLAALEGAPAKNRVTAGIAAVDLFENKLDRFDQALEVLLMLHAAKLTSLPVRERLARAAARTGSWTDATAILEELMHERVEPEARVEAARLAMAIHRDRLGAPKAARDAVHKLLDEAPIDGEGVEMLLAIEDDPDVRARYMRAAKAGLLETVAVRPFDLSSVKRLAKVARALGEDGLQQAALSVALALGGSEPTSEQLFAQLAARKPRAPQIVLNDAMFRAILAPGDGGPIAELFMLLGPTLAEALGPSLVACNVKKVDRVDPKSGVAVRNEIAAWTGAFGIREFDLYIGGKEPLGVQGVPGEVPSLVVGAGVNAPLAPITRARIARELFAMVRGTTVIRHRDETTIAAIVIAACNIAEVKVESPAYAMLSDVERLLAKALPRKTKKLLGNLCRTIARGNTDARAWARAVHASHARVAVLASGDAGVVLSDLLNEPLERLSVIARNDVRAEALLRFVLSPTYLELRRALGLEGAS